MRISPQILRLALGAPLALALVGALFFGSSASLFAAHKAPTLSPEDMARLASMGLASQSQQDCSAAFKLVDTPTFDSSKNELRAVTTFSPNDVWSVGIAGGATLIEHWDGSKWARVTSPTIGTYQRLDGVGGVGPQDIWAVGWYDTGSGNFSTLAIHYDGSSWKIAGSPNIGQDTRVYSVSAVSSTDVWAVGAQNSHNFTMHWDGKTWSSINTPDTGARSELNGVVALAPNDVWAVGGAGNKTLTMHWDGSAWTVVTSPNQHNYDRLYSVSSRGPNDVWAAGGVIMHWDGKAWTINDALPDGQAYRGIAALGATDVWAGGYGKDTGGPNKNIVKHWDGKTWTVVTSLSPSNDGNQINDLDGSNPGDIWAVGNVGPSQSFQPSAQHYVNSCLTSTAPTATPGASGSSTKPAAAPVDLPGTNSQTFAETGKTVKGVFLDYWNAHGGLAQQGYPVSDLIGEKSDLDGKVYTVQYFQRAVFEYHPENAAPNNVLLSQLGTFVYKAKYPNGAPDQKPNSSDGSQLFDQTGHRTGGEFLAYWNANGGLAQQGLPISDEFQEKSATDGKTYTVQYFERAVFEYHPENAAPYNVLLSLLGSQRYLQVYGSY